MRYRVKKVIGLLCGLAVICGIAAGCQDSQWSEEPFVPPGVSEPEQSASGAFAEPEAVKSLIKPGVWMARDGEFGQYYFFDADGISGRTQRFENGMGLGFTYEQSGEMAVFHMGASDTTLPCKVIVVDETHIELAWEGRYTETLTFHADLDSRSFHFYTDEELCQLALEDYRAKKGAGEEVVVVAADNGDGTVTIQLYQNMGGYNSTVAWYQIDRITGEGQDVNSGNPIDLTDGAPDMDIAQIEPETTMPEDFYECVVDAFRYSSRLLLTPTVPVTAFRVVLLEYTESENVGVDFHITGELFTAVSLTPEKPLVLHVVMPETIPNVGITYADRNGEARLYAISESGLDGSPLLLEERLSNP